MQALVPSAAAPPLWHQLAAVAVSLQQCVKPSELARTCSHNAHIEFGMRPSAQVCTQLLRQGAYGISSSSNNASSVAQLHSAKQGSNSTDSSKGIKSAEIKQLRVEIFEQHIGDGKRSGRKAILKPLRGRVMADWYFTLKGPKMHLFDDPLEEE